ncbi:MAG: hypothetical protein NT154_28620 [Verrucomicrobia bacterium]|nr:hypothetical protein [Verrucomicrobiota bacterium]
MNRNLNWWLIGLMLLAPAVMAQTSGKGTSSTAWGTAANWTAGVPTASVDAIIGDANFTGTFQPRLTSGSGLCRSLTLGTGTKASTLTVSRSLTVSGSITIGSFGTLSHTATSTSRLISLSGNWVNSGTYTTSSSSCRFRVCRVRCRHLVRGQRRQDPGSSQHVRWQLHH